MTYDTLIDDFLETIPTDKDIVIAIMQNNGINKTDGMHIVFSICILNYLLQIINDTDKIKKVCTFFEAMATSNDILIQEVLNYSILELLITEGHSILDPYKKYMGPNTLDNCIKIEQFYCISE